MDFSYNNWLRRAGVVDNLPTPYTWNTAVYMCIKHKLAHRKEKNIRKPIELNILKIAKECKLSYKQVRYSIENMIKAKIIEKFTVSIGGEKPYRISRYRWTEKY